MSRTITSDSEEIVIEGHIGTWSVVETEVYDGVELFLLEHEDYGDEAAYLVVDEECNIIMDDVYNGFSELDDLEEKPWLK